MDVELRIRGLHCPACPPLVDELLAQDPALSGVRTDGASRRVHLSVDLADGEDLPLARWNGLLEPHGYRLIGRPSATAGLVTRGLVPEVRDTLRGVAAGLGVLGLFVALQVSGWLTLFSPDTLEPSGALVLGVLASLSSCFALVGGLLMTLTASVGRAHPGRLASTLAAFHVGRLVTFGLLGGVLGQLGHALTFDQGVFNVLFLVAALTMVTLGLNLLGVVRWPGGSRDRTRQVNQRLARAGTTGTGLLLGVGTFFLPCGFTQTVQFQALATGSFGSGAALMLAFALGTLPVLLLVSVALKVGLAGAARRLLLTASGVVVIGLGLFQLQSALVLLRVMRPLLVL